MISLDLSGIPLLSYLVFLPLVGALCLYLPIFPSKPDSPTDTPPDASKLFFSSSPQITSFVFSFLSFIVSLTIALRFDCESGAFQFKEHYSWIPSFGISYAIGVDGISLVLILLTTILMPLVILASSSIASNQRAYLANMLILETAILGTLVSMDVFLFYVFWEMMLIPMYFIIGLWGGPRRIYATLKFVIYTLSGSVLMLAGLIYIVWQYQAQQNQLTFFLPDLIQFTNLSYRQEIWLFLAFALAFGIKIPLFPFHTWLPDAHVEAPTGGSVILAGVLLKMGIYGFLRFSFPLFPRAVETLAPIIALLGLIGIIYGAMVAWAQTDIKKLVAYSSVSHLGFCVLGLMAFNLVSTTGAIFQMISHGISTGALFLLVGVLYQRRHTREISEFGGLANKLPIFALVFMIFTLSSIALPLTNGFVGEFMILAGSFRVWPWITGAALLGVILSAIYMLTLYLKTMFGEFNEKKNGSLLDMTKQEVATLLPLVVLVFALGLYPKPITQMIESSVDSLIGIIDERKSILEQNEANIEDGKVDESRVARLSVSYADRVVFRE